MAGELAAFKTTNVQFIAVPAASVPPGAMFQDQSNNALSTAQPGGAPPQIIGVIQQMNIKNMVIGESIPNMWPVAKRSTDGKLVRAVSDGSGGRQQWIGYSQAAGANDGDVIAVLLLGVNMPGAVAGMGFEPGQDVYLAEGGGYTNDPNSFTGGNDSIIKVGIADCAEGVASAVATDLITFADVLTRP